MENPNNVASGELARLIPVISDTRKEQRALSVLLAVFAAVPLFADAVLRNAGTRIGKRTRITTLTEVVLKNGDSAPKARPDGLIELTTGKHSWTALIEAKIGNAPIEQDQVELYLKVARDNSINAVITLSNEFATLPTHHPLVISKVLTRRVGLFHFSWNSILTEAIILHEGDAISDPEQKFLLREFIRFFSHESAGVTGFTSMPADWKSVVDRVVAGGRLTARGGNLEGITASWHQEIRDLALQMGQALGCHVNVKLKRSHRQSQETRLRDAIDILCKENVLREEIEVPDAASEITVTADLETRTIRASMSLLAPQNRKGNEARVRWLLRQLKEVDPLGVTVSLIWPSRAPDSIFPLSTLREDLSVVSVGPSDSAPRAFTITLTCDSGRRFTGRRTFIEDIESTLPDFYERVGEHLKAWVPSPPKIKTAPKESSLTIGSTQKPSNQGQIDQERTRDTSVKPPTLVKVGNDPNELLDIPDFLRRHGN